MIDDPNAYTSEDAPTPPMGLTLGDRIVLDTKIAVLRAELVAEHAWVESLLTERHKRDARQESRVDKLRNVVWFATGMATASLVVQLIRIVALIVIKDGKI